MAQIIGMQNAGQATSPEAQGVNGQPNNMGGVQGAPQQPQDLGVTGTGNGNIGIRKCSAVRGRVNSLVRLEQLDLQVREAINRKEET
jgi:hypothetical protein